MPSNTRRTLVLTHESAGHWLRRALPPHVFTAPLHEDVEAAENAEAARNWRLSDGDWRRFVGTYCAGFVAASIFIA